MVDPRMLLCYAAAEALWERSATQRILLMRVYDIVSGKGKTCPLEWAWKQRAEIPCVEDYGDSPTRS
ncbi:hypothetical protein NDU88_001457 [Pleurodeles waltl]|uniref:Uncharacterized protein n=1 Tax=Pleurodeles waltl TaxID=8319 RepID=A0AAV7LBH2_PLEWA|nr:hypothetical protein NDU88_001457 [Pleurodeles waltl]